MHRTRKFIAWLMTLVFMSSAIAQVSTNPVVSASSPTKRVEVKITKNGVMYDSNGKRIDKRLFQEASFDAEGKKPLQPGEARKRKEVMYMDESLLNATVIPKNVIARHKNYMKFEPKVRLNKNDVVAKNGRKLSSGKLIGQKFKTIYTYKSIDEYPPCLVGVKSDTDPRLCVKEVVKEVQVPGTSPIPDPKKVAFSYELTSEGKLPDQVIAGNSYELPKYKLSTKANGVAAIPVPVEVTEWEVSPTNAGTVQNGRYTVASAVQPASIVPVYKINGTTVSATAVTVPAIPASDNPNQRSFIDLWRELSIATIVLIGLAVIALILFGLGIALPARRRKVFEWFKSRKPNFGTWKGENAWYQRSWRWVRVKFTPKSKTTKDSNNGEPASHTRADGDAGPQDPAPNEA